MEQREKLGLTSGQQSNPRKYAEATTAMEKVQVCKLIDYIEGIQAETSKLQLSRSTCDLTEVACFLVPTGMEYVVLQVHIN